MLEYSFVFFILGGFNLAKLALEDMKTKMVDIRLSYLMSGVVLTLFFLEGRVLEMLVVAFLFYFLLSEIKKRKWLHGLEDGDISILGWIVPGLYFINLWLVGIFFLGFSVLMFYFRQFVYKAEGFPVSGIFAVSFCLTWIISVIL